MKATITYSNKDNKTILLPESLKTIKYNSLKGLKRGIYNNFNLNKDNLRRFFGNYQQISYEVRNESGLIISKSYLFI